ncbi:restriction endonuclease subunit S [Streptococcus thermophilus]|uniref:restriction endonuclease subunit S n=4 Tax=Streptococcus thermophilus TaxID=1308 RepID=UPI0022B9175C|nr:restriction endonuclease subunit S [Streptococcus thermophilus]
MMSKKVPELRFKGFTDDWEKRKLKDIAQFNPKTVLPDEFEYVDLESVVGTEMISHRTVSKEQAPSRAQRLAQKGDVFYQTVRPYQMNNYLYDLPYDNYVFSTGYAQMRPNIDSYFLLNSVQNKQFVQHVLERSTGTSYPAINSSDLSNIKIYVPVHKEEEQQKIGAFFKHLDDTIALHQRKLDLLKEQKKGFLQKMFPKNGAKVPELRFAGFADDWEERKLGDLLNKNSEKNKNLSVINVESVSNKTGFTKQTDQFKDYSVASVDLSNYYVIREKQFAYNPSRINVGSIAYKDLGDEISVVSPLYVSFSTKKVLNDGFLWNWFKTASFDAQRQRLSEGGVRDTLSFNQLSEMNIMFPTYPEQEKIGSFFKQLDEIIALHQRKLDLLKEQKKGFLQKMFV